MLSNQQELFNSIELLTIFFIMLVSIIIIVAVLYHNKVRAHRIAVIDYENALIKSQYEVQEQTMQTIGTDLHDNIGQMLSLTSLTLGSIEFSDIDKATQKVEAALDLTRRSVKELRLLGKLLQGGQLISKGLTKAISHEITWLEKSGKFAVKFSTNGEPPSDNNKDKDLIIFRILQETLNNTIKHAAASTIEIALEYGKNWLRLKIEDNGKGFDLSDEPGSEHGIGLQNMHKRAEIIGGDFKVSSALGEGTRISLYTPYP